MQDDDETSADQPKPKPKVADASALPAQLGRQLRNLFAEAESQPVPDRLRQLLEQLAAKEKKAE